MQALTKLESFKVDVDSDWHSCTLSDEDAYQDAMERNSVATMFTPVCGNSTAASVAPYGDELVKFLADADEALEALAQDLQPPALEAEDPAAERLQVKLNVQASGRVELELFTPVANGKDSVLAEAVGCDTASSTAEPSPPADDTASDVVGHLLMRSPHTVKPHNSTTARKLKEMDSSSQRDPATPKDQNKNQRHAENPLRRSFGMLGAGIFRVLSNLRVSGGGARPSADPPPVTTQELASELLSGAEPAGLSYAVAQSRTVHVNYVHDGAITTPASNSAEPQDTSSGDDAAAVARAMSSGIIRNVLRASADVHTAATKAMLSPRDTISQPVAVSSPQRDQHAPHTAPSASTTPARASVSGGSPQSSSRQLSPDEKPHPDGLAALALLRGLAQPAVPEEASSIEAPGVLLPAGASGEASEGGGLPMPDLEACDSPVVANRGSNPISPVSVAAQEAPAPEPVAAIKFGVEQDALSAALPVGPVPAAVGAAAGQGAADSPSTLSRRAYGTVAMMVRKMVPGFRDSTAASLAASSLPGGPLQSAFAVAAPPLDVPETRAPVSPPSVGPSSAPAAEEVTLHAPEGQDVMQAAGKETSGATAAEEAPSQAPAEAEPDTDAATPTACTSASDATPGAPGMFIFGEHPKGKHPIVIKTRQLATKLSAGAQDHSPSAMGTDEDGSAVPGSCRKRKADETGLPRAKLADLSNKQMAVSAAWETEIEAAQEEPAEAPATDPASTSPGAACEDLPSEPESAAPPGCASSEPLQAGAGEPTSATPESKGMNDVPVTLEQHAVQGAKEVLVEVVTPAVTNLQALQPPAKQQAAPAALQLQPPAKHAAKKAGMFACFGCFSS